MSKHVRTEAVSPDPRHSSPDEGSSSVRRATARFSRGPRGRFWLGLGTGVVAGALLVGGVAVAAIPTAGSGVIYGCRNVRTGALRVIDAAAHAKCVRGEAALSWNSKGVTGPRGLAGVKGDPGAKGDPGVKGDPGLSGVTPSQFQSYSAKAFTGTAGDQYLVGFLTLGAGTWNIHVHAMPYNTMDGGFQVIPEAGNPGIYEVREPVVQCELIAPNLATVSTEYVSVPFAPGGGPTGVAQMSIDTQLTIGQAATYTLKCGQDYSGTTTPETDLGVSNVDITATQVTAA